MSEIRKLYLPALFIIILVLLFLGLVNFFNISYPISITMRTESGEFSVVGEGKVEIVPDIATVNAGISVENVKTQEEAQNKIDEINNKIIAAVAALGIDKKDIKTSSYSINPSYGAMPVFGGKQESTGFSGNASVTITVRKRELLPKVLTTATDAGATNVYNGGFVVDDPSKYREQARQKAIENAKEQAQKLSSQLGIRLGRITNIVESSAGGIPVQMYEGAKRLDASVVQPPIIEPGTQEVSSQVTLYFEKR